MKLLHVTDAKDRESIISKGLIAGYQPYLDTRWLTETLDKHQPKEKFSHIDIKKCIWFTPGNSTYKYKYYDYPLNLVVDSKKLNKDKLYYLDGRITERLEKAEPEKRSKLARKFWQEIKPFSEYLILFGDVEELTRNIDVLYFGDIPPEKLEVFIETQA